MSINPFDRQAAIPGIKHIILVGSGKGGVGKSTVAANLSLSLKHLGKNVGLLDADVYGPSIPRLFGALNQAPPMSEQNRLLPIRRHGLPLMSMGFLIDEGSAVVWRGPMLFKAIDQFLKDVEWGELDYLIVDLPPGTGDVALTMAQKVPVDGAIVVCTPQNLALVDAKKAVDMFERLNVPVLGLIENMSYFRPSPESEAIQLFPKGDLDAFCDFKKLKKLSEIPFKPTIGLTCEAGIPCLVADINSEESQTFIKAAEALIQTIES